MAKLEAPSDYARLFFAAPRRDCELRKQISQRYLADEATTVQQLLDLAQQGNEQTNVFIQNNACDLVKKIRADDDSLKGLDAFLLEYDLSTKEGIILMCIAEALLRIPDDETADKLIHDKLLAGDWRKHIEHSDSLLVNASTWGLLLTGKVVNFEETTTDISGWLKRMVAKSGEPIIRAAMRQAMAILGQQFVMGETIEAALKRSMSGKQADLRYSFDMLGEAAMTEADALHFFHAYQHAIVSLANSTRQDSDFYNKPSISIKLSALHPRYQISQQQRVRTELRARLYALARLAKEHNLCVTIDAEESERLELSLDLFESLYTDPTLADWSGLGLAVQAYQKRAHAVIVWLIHLSKTQGKRIPVRLVKGAYWDSEIKRSQELGLEDYPVFTRKYHTDLSYQVCAQTLLNQPNEIYPQFATHNAYTIAYIMAHTDKTSSFEFQRLHGMGVALYEASLRHYPDRTIYCRVYAPVGGHKELLPYLVRRLLENGANTSFINRIQDKATPIDKIVRNPLLLSQQHQGRPHTHIPLPRFIFGQERLNSKGYNLYDEATLVDFGEFLQQRDRHQWAAYPLINGVKVKTQAQPRLSPIDSKKIIGHVHHADSRLIDEALNSAANAQLSWQKTAAATRCRYIAMTAELIETNFQECLALLILEAGKTITDAVAEVREAIDFCRYYAQQGEKIFNHPIELPGPTGEKNLLYLAGRGTFVCISPWNFPLAIFIGQISAALVAGNTVIAKPAGQTALIAAFAVDLLQQAGIPNDVLHLIPGSGSLVGKQLIPDPRVKGIVFTGSTDTAQIIHHGIASRSDGIIPFIAETGGQNTMIVDSSALPEQVVRDVMNSAFNSAGQRCSALRVLYLQQDIADKVIAILQGAMAELCLGDPRLYATDIGPVIDTQAKTQLDNHIQNMTQQAKLITTRSAFNKNNAGVYVAPTVFEIESIQQLEKEVFGPILHIIRFQEDALDEVIAEINNTGYGLTLGIHSRIESTINTIVQQAHVGNIYINRNMIGAVVGVQPFGGEGMSGTGPKAGGPHYLYRFCTERCVSTNTAAVGGNTSLLALDGED